MEKQWGGRRVGAGRRPKPVTERAVIKGKVAIHISVESAAQLEKLMLRDMPGVGTPEQMVEALIQDGLLLTPDIRAALPWLEEARRMCFNEQAQRGLDQPIAALIVNAPASAGHTPQQQELE